MENNRKRPQDEVPYEVIVSYIIRDYRRNLQSLEMLEPYTRQLEEVVRQQQQELQAVRKQQKLKQNEYDNTDALRKITKSALQKRITQLEQWITSYGLPIPEPTQSQLQREQEG